MPRPKSRAERFSVGATAKNGAPFDQRQHGFVIAHARVLATSLPGSGAPQSGREASSEGIHAWLCEPPNLGTPTGFEPAKGIHARVFGRRPMEIKPRHIARPTGARAL